jgi:competence protein ComEC
VPVGVATLVVLAGCALGRAPDGRLHVTTLDIGQGDAILVQTPAGRTMLIDGGPEPEVTLRELAGAMPLGAWSIDVVLLTHPHHDHVMGLIEALHRYRVRLVLDGGRAYEGPDYPRFLSDARRAGRYALARAGQRLDLGSGVSFTVLYPADADAAAPLPDGDINNASVVGLLRYGGFGALLTGDAELPVEDMLVARRLLQPVDLLKVGHHGSESSTGHDLLAATSPSIATISVGAGNEYGHPHAATLDALATVPGLRVFRTDVDGSVDVRSDGRSVSVASGSGTAVTFHVEGSVQVTGATIGRWPSRPSPMPASCFSTSGYPMASSSTVRGWRESPPGLRGWSSVPASRSTRASSRSPPSCTISTS